MSTIGLWCAVRQLLPSTAEYTVDESQRGLVPRADIHRAAPEPPQSNPRRRFGPIEADDGSSSEAVTDRRTGRATVVHPISIPPPPVDGDQHWGERVGFKGPSTLSDNSLPLRRRETGIPDGSKIVCIAMAATTFVARSA
jgi:hypothetical protein